MPIINRIADFHEEMTAWRRDLHAHPETAFEEFRTSGIVAAKLEEWGIEVHRGLGGTGVVGTLKGGGASGIDKSIALRADMDALNMQEQNDFPHASKIPGKMHGCGHDGHTTMLLGAAKYLAETRNSDGTVHFIFQPAEEGKGGAQKMVEEGLFDLFPVSEVYGMHNWPEMPAGTIAVRTGPIMAAADQFDIKDYVAMSRVMGITMLISVIDVVLITALATLGAFIYNMSAAMLGGIEVTLAEDLD